MNQPIIWALLDGRAGNDNQTLAIAERMGRYVTKHIEFKPWGKLPNALLGTSLFGVKLDMQEPLPDLVISTGRKLARVSAHLKKNYGSNVFHIMYPGKKYADMFNFVITPEHDGITEGENIITIPGSICKVHPTPSTQTEFTVSVLVGKITEQEAHELAGLINYNPANYLISTSRRTPGKAADILQQEITQQKYIYRYGSEEPNPYHEFLTSAHALIVSGDSVNMCTEAAHTGKPVYIFEVDTKPKFQAFWKQLYALGCARPLTDKISLWEYKALNNLNNVMRIISSAKQG